MNIAKRFFNMSDQDIEGQNGEVSRHFGVLVEVWLAREQIVQAIVIVTDEDAAAVGSFPVHQRQRAESLSVSWCL